jgi:hypothetical protein
VSGCYSCTLTAGTSSAGVPSYTRGCNNATISTTNYCSTGFCSCTAASLCNSHTFSTLGSLTCYTCASVNGIDNGCGRVINSNSIYVTKQSGCTACGLTITPSNPIRSGGGWYRSCLHDVDVNSTCSNSGSSSSCSFRCTSDLCNANSAPLTRQAAVSTLTAALALVAAALKLV